MYDVRCTYCGGIYNVGKVEVLARYTDCSVWKAPCCGRTVDDRGETGWTTRKDYVRIDSAEAKRPCPYCGLPAGDHIGWSCPRKAATW